MLPGRDVVTPNSSLVGDAFTFHITQCFISPVVCSLANTRCSGDAGESIIYQQEPQRNYYFQRTP